MRSNLKAFRDIFWTRFSRLYFLAYAVGCLTGYGLRSRFGLIISIVILIPGMAAGALWLVYLDIRSSNKALQREIDFIADPANLD